MTGKRWTGSERVLLATDYRTKGAAVIAAETGRSETSVRIKACRMGQKRMFHMKTSRGKRVLTPGGRDAENI